MERRLTAALMARVSACLCLTGCTSNRQPFATLKTTLEARQTDGGLVAFQNGQPVPDFGVQQRPRLPIDGSWRFQAAQFDDSVSFIDRKQTLGRLTAEAGPRLREAYDDSGWQLSSVPGTFNLPPAGRASGGWYRTRFSMPTVWPERTSLRFGSVNYVADVWLNGRYLGYHEGGTTPFAFDPGDALHRIGLNTLVVRVSRPLLGVCIDLVPWGLTDW